jgi:diacylglycerol O-acyltransferase / wax synthase
MGRQVLEVLPIPPIALRLRTGIAMVSYADSFFFGITADYDTAPEVDEFANGIEDGLKRLAAISRARRTRGRPIPAASAS